MQSVVGWDMGTSLFGPKEIDVLAAFASRQSFYGND